MTAWLAWTRHDLARRRWRLASLAVLVALGAGVVLSAVAGTRRSASAIERMERAVVLSTATVLPNEPGFDWSLVEALPEVSTLVRFPVSTLAVKELGEAYGGFPPASPGAVSEIERPVVIEGRVADQQRRDEVTISPDVRKLGVDIGDELTLLVTSPDDQLAGTDGTVTSATVTVVGVTKGSFFTAGVQPTYAFFETYEERLVGHRGYINAIVRLRRGPADIPALQRHVDELAGHPVEIWDNSATNERYRRAVNLETAALGAFGVATFVAVVVLVGQAVSRMAGARAGEPSILRQLGFTRRAAMGAIASAPTLAAVVGIAAAPVVAYALSDRYPIGIGRITDPDVGRRADWIAYAVGAAALLGAFVCVVVVASRRVVVGATPRASRPAGSSAAAFARPVDAPVWMTIGSALALRWRRHAGPAAVTGIATCGIAAVVGAITFSAGLDRATTDSSLYGQYYDVYADVQAADDVADLAATVPSESAARLRNVIVGVDGHSVSTVSITPISGRSPLQPRRGTLPRDDDEIALAPEELDTLDVDLGDSVRLGDGTELTVVGEVFTPVTAHTTYSSGAVVTSGLTDRLLADGVPLKFDALGFELPPGADPAGALATLAESSPGYAEVVGPVERQDALRPTRQLPVLFGSFVAVLALAAAAHGLASTERRRRHEVAVLQVLGLVRVQARLTVVWHATLSVAVGLAVGIPIGFALGRTLWEAVAASLPAVYRTPHAWVLVAAAVPVALVSAYVAAAWPVRRTARNEPASVLRAE
jgi:ABC-type lipoprotein release transport system permease subunit